MKRLFSLTLICALSSFAASSAFAFKMPSIQDPSDVESLLLLMKDVPADERQAAIEEAKAELDKIVQIEVLAGTKFAPELIKLSMNHPETKEKKSATMVVASTAASIKLFSSMKATEDEGTILKIRTTEGDRGAAACAQFDSKAFAALAKKTGVSDDVAMDVRLFLNLSTAIIGASIRSADSSCVVNTGI